MPSRIRRIGSGGKPKQIFDQLADLVGQTAGFELLFAVLTPVTDSASEWVGNAAVAGRFAAKAKPITEIIAPLVAREPLLERIQTWIEQAKTVPLRGGGSAFGQPVDLNGKPGPRSATHISINPNGSFPKPQGW